MKHIHYINNKKGSALILVLSLLSLLVAVSLRQRVVSRHTLNIENRLARNTELLCAAQDAALSALTLIRQDQTFMETALPESVSPVLETVLPNGISVNVMITDENRFLDVNLLNSVIAEKAPELLDRILISILEATGVVDPELKTELIKERIRNNETRDISRDKKPPSSPLNAPAELAELLSTSLSSNQVSKLLTVIPSYSFRISRINVNTAEPILMACLLGRENSQIVDYLCRLREKKKISSLSILDGLENRIDMDTLKAMLTTKSVVFSITARAEHDGRSVEIYAMAEHNEDGSSRVLRWVRR